MGIITTELRYFFEAQIETELKRELQNWLKVTGERTDIYLKPVESKSVGIKMREGQIEVKSLIKSHDQGTLACQTWEKISLGEGELNGDTIAVKKSRWLIYVDEELQNVNPVEHINCQVEISEVQITKKRFWSLCLEVGNSESEKERLDLLEHVWLNLRARYPKLQNLVRGTEPQSYPEKIV